MIEGVLFGVGAAGNKAAINAIEKGIINPNNVWLINTTLQDIPTKYKVDNNQTITFSSMLGGCGKEPAKGRDSMIQAITKEDIDFSSMINPTTKVVYIITSIEGGTGSGSVPVIVKYFEALNIPVHVFAFVGFQDEIRGVANSLKFFKDLGNNIILHVIRNSAFLNGDNNSYIKAEKAANDEFVSQLQILIGGNMISSEQNIDKTDHYKIMTTNGYMSVYHIDLNDNVKSRDTVNDRITYAFDNDSGLTYEAGCKIIAVIINASDKIQSCIDDTFSVVKRYTGVPYEIYKHIQDDGSGNNYMNIIVGGLGFPKQAIIDLSNKYSVLKEKLDNRNKEIPSNIFDGIDFEDEYDTEMRQMNNAAEAKNIFAQMFNQSVVEEKPKRKETIQVVNKTIDLDTDGY